MFEPSKVMIAYYLAETKGGVFNAGVEQAVPVPSDHFVVAFQRGKSGAEQVNPADLRSIPKLIVNQDLREYHSTQGGRSGGGSNNIADLVTQARGIADLFLREPRVIDGGQYECVGFHPVWPSSSITQVRYRMTDRQCSTDVVVGAFDFSPDGSATYAFREAVERFGFGERRASQGSVPGAQR